MLPLAPMLLSRAGSWPTRAGWVLEPKWDGFRVLAAVDDGRGRAWTRHGTEITAAIRAVLDELAAVVPAGSVVDGELVALAEASDGRVGQDFARLAPAVFAGRPYPLSLVVFDAPRWAGESLTGRPWRERRAALEGALLPRRGRHVGLVDVFAAEVSVHERLVALGFEGSVLKRREGRYLPGRRATGWRKVKSRARTRATLELVSVDRVSARVQSVGCRAHADRGRVTWAVVWGGELGSELTRDPAAAVGRSGELTYTHRTIGGALREARLTALA
jgi:bifunctional non-homologous end joining protein LigD